MDAVGGVDLQFGRAFHFQHFKYPGRAVALGGFSPGGQIDLDRNALVLQLEVARLILVVTGVGQIHRREFVKAQLAIGFGIMDGLAAAGHAQLTVVVSLIEQLEGRVCAKQLLLQPVEGTAQPETIAVKRRAEVARRLEFAGQPALLQLVAILGQIPAPSSPPRSAIATVFAASMPDFMAVWIPLMREKSRVPASQPISRPPGKCMRGRACQPLGDGAGAIADAFTPCNTPAISG